MDATVLVHSQTACLPYEASKRVGAQEFDLGEDMVGIDAKGI
jgi:hypothetical protein